MGGTVALTIRDPKNKEYRMNRWTNILPEALTNWWLIQKHPLHVTHTLRMWRQMRTDYIKNRSHGNYSNSMTGIYFPCVGLAPVSYGLVVVDMVNNVILSAQGYTHIGSLNYSYYTFRDYVQGCGDIDLALEAIHKELIVQTPVWDESSVLTFARLFENKRIRVFNRWCAKNSQEVPLDISNITLRDILDAPRDENMFRGGMGFHVDMSPFTVENFKEDFTGFSAMKSRVDELGFKLTDPEKEAWDIWLNELLENESEDEDLEDEEKEITQ